MNNQYAYLVAQLHAIRRVITVKTVLIAACGFVTGCNAPDALAAIAASLSSILSIGCEVYNDRALKRLSDKVDQIQQSALLQKEDS